MGRPERPLDPTAGPVPRLAHELRELRRAAGSPSYRTMAKTAGFSPTTLSQAAAGERLPSLAVVQGVRTGLRRRPGGVGAALEGGRGGGRRGRLASDEPGTARRRTGASPGSSRTTGTCSSAGTA